MGTEGVIVLTHWFEKIESVFYIYNCSVAFHIKFATCTVLGNTLTWWNSHVKTVGHDVAYGMPWKTLKKMTTTSIAQELTLMCGRMFSEEFNEVKKYVGGLPDMIQGSVMASKQKTMQDAIEFANDLMDQSPAATNNQRTLTCYECGNQGHYRSDFPELKNQNHRNQARGAEARKMVYALGGGEDQDIDNMKDDINTYTLFL
nr:hypothetical protein [Tanacetum cinerariifolium]